MISSTSSENGYFRRYQNITVSSAGTYTFSAYVKTNNIVSPSDGGAYLILDGVKSERLTGTTSRAIQNGWRRISVTKTFTEPKTVQVQLRLANASGTVYFDCLQNEKIASVDSLGEITDGYLNKAGRKFVKNNLPEITFGINKWWNHGK